MSTEARTREELRAALKMAERWLSGMHSETNEGVETEMRDVHSAAWQSTRCGPPSAAQS